MPDYSTNPLVVVAQILEDDAVGTFATDIFISKEPDSPDNCLTLYWTGGFPDDCLDVDSRNREVINFQVRVRNNDYLTAHAKMEEVRDSLEKAKFKQVSDSTGDLDVSCWLTNLPNDLQRDTTNRSIVTANFSMMRSLTS